MALDFCVFDATLGGASQAAAELHGREEKSNGGVNGEKQGARVGVVSADEGMECEGRGDRREVIDGLFWVPSS